jgi:hypothetical protein
VRSEPKKEKPSKNVLHNEIEKGRGDQLIRLFVICSTNLIYREERMREEENKNNIYTSPLILTL